MIALVSSYARKPATRLRPFRVAHSENNSPVGEVVFKRLFVQSGHEHAFEGGGPLALPGTRAIHLREGSHALHRAHLRPDFLLPNGDVLLQLIDEKPARFERLGPMRC